MCDGPLIWFGAGSPENGAVLECASAGCAYIATTGGLHDEAHAHTDMLTEGLA